MDEVSSHVCLVLPSTDGKAARKIVPPRLRIPYWKGLGADSEEKHEPVSDIDAVVVDSLKALDLERPIREEPLFASRLISLKSSDDGQPRTGRSRGHSNVQAIQHQPNSSGKRVPPFVRCGASRMIQRPP